MTATATTVSYKLCESTGKGMGLFASDRKIARGELIIAEKPLLTLDQRRFLSLSFRDAQENLDRSIEKLAKTDKQTFYSLHNSWPKLASQSMGIIKTNAVPLGVDSPVGAIFPVISRINHSCLPNVNHYWNEMKGVETIFALKDIEANQEILTSYTDPFCDRATRQALIREGFQFECQCVLCSLEDKTEQKRSDIRRNLIKSLDADIFDLAAYSPAKAMDKVYLMERLLNEEGVAYDANKMGSY